jgi:D-alanyl-D-alanine carboxypeptidase
MSEDPTFEAAQQRLQSRLDELHEELGFVGATAAFVLADGQMGAAATGLADRERNIPMTPDHRMAAGSIGKTIAGMTALSMVADGLIELDDPAQKWLGQEPWFERLANHDTMTLRQLLSHSAGVIDHVYDDDWRKAARARRSGPNADPDAYFTPRELVGYILDKPALFAAGEGYHYTDTGLIIAGLMLEAAAGHPFYDEAQRRVLEPHGLTLTEAQSKRDFDNLASGYMGTESPYGLPDKVSDQGVMSFSPHTEWTGGGYVSNSQDLARWAKIMYEERALPTPYLDVMLSSGYRGEDAHDIYGITVFIVDQDYGRILGHGGQYPGYRSSMYYHPETRLALALQVNQFEPDVHNILRDELFKALLEVVR